MENILGAGASGATLFFLFAALALALSFEFVNSFHDTANAVATVIYTFDDADPLVRRGRHDVR
jgi:PiT family inorganic phosphate transporter